MTILAGHRNLYRLSLESQSRPADHGDNSHRPHDSDNLDDVAERLGPFGVEVLKGGFGQLLSTIPRCELTDEVVIDVTRPIDLPLIEHALRPIGRRILSLQPV